MATVRRAVLEDLELALFVRRIYRLTGLDLRSYKGEQLRRRLNAAMAHLGARNLLDLANILERDPARIEDFHDRLTINVSEFFRDPERFQYLEEKVLPAILQENRNPALWSAGCANGAEPYSLAMIMADLMPQGGYRILATDIDGRVLEQARNGDGYRWADVRNVDPRRLAQYFRREGDRYAVVESIRRAVEFRQHNLLADPYEKGLDLIACRNVVIYFTEEAKNTVFTRMAQALREGGILFVGVTEMLGRAHDRYFVSVGPGFYRRTPNN